MDYIKTIDGLIPKETTLLDDLVAACPNKDTEILDWIDENIVYMEDIKANIHKVEDIRELITKAKE